MKPEGHTRKQRAKKGEPQTVTRAVTHLQMSAANPGKLAALDQLASEFLTLTQRYVTLFCTDELPDGFRAPCSAFGSFTTYTRQKGHRSMDALLFMGVVSLLIIAGVVSSVCLYTRALGTGRFRRIRRVRARRPLPSDTVMEEIIEEEAPVAELV